MNNNNLLQAMMMSFRFFQKTALCTLWAMLISIGVMAQSSSLSNEIKRKTAKRTVIGAEIGSLICENANGVLSLCNGSIEETVMGIATGVPYVTLNKPTTPNGSKSIFIARVSSDNGNIESGDLLVANKGGTLAKATGKKAAFAYAVALEDLSGGKGNIRVKVVSR